MILSTKPLVEQCTTHAFGSLTSVFAKELIHLNDEVSRVHLPDVDPLSCSKIVHNIDIALKKQVSTWTAGYFGTPELIKTGTISEHAKSICKAVQSSVDQVGHVISKNVQGLASSVWADASHISVVHETLHFTSNPTCDANTVSYTPLLETGRLEHAIYNGVVLVDYESLPGENYPPYSDGPPGFDMGIVFEVFAHQGSAYLSITSGRTNQADIEFFHSGSTVVLDEDMRTALVHTITALKNNGASTEYLPPCPDTVPTCEQIAAGVAFNCALAIPSNSPASFALQVPANYLAHRITPMLSWVNHLTRQTLATSDVSTTCAATCTASTPSCTEKSLGALLRARYTVNGDLPLVEGSAYTQAIRTLRSNWVTAHPSESTSCSTLYLTQIDSALQDDFVEILYSCHKSDVDNLLHGSSTD